MTKQARVHPLRRLSVGEEQEMKEVNHNQNIKTRKTSWQQIGQEVKAVSRWKTYKSSMRDHSLEGYINRTAERPRVVHDSCKNLSKKTQLCVLDSDVDNLGEQNFSPYDAFGCLRQSVSHGVTPEEALISSKTMIIYFAKLAKASLEEEQVIDFDFLQELLDEGADINFTDSHGQTVFHEVARIWNVDVAKFMLENGGLVNNADDYGRTPLHVASAVDYPEMIEFLITNQANIHVKTKGEMQTPIHYAAKNDAGQALKMLLKLGANVEDRDYKNRTPLQVAAELDRSDTAKLLIDKGTSAGVQDDSGSCVLSLMISKMPPVAKEALDQFHSADRANRKQYYYLNYLEPYKPPKGGECHAKTPLQCVVSFKQMDLIMHPVFQRLIDVKWQQFGRRGVVLQLLVQLFYVFIWTALAVTLHLREGANFYNPLSKYWWRIVLETIACSMTVYFILQEFLEISASKKAHRKWQHWRIQELQKDLKFCHPRWPEERKYLEMELREISELGISYFNDAWNYFDWVTYGWVLGMIVTRVLDVASITGLHLRISAVGIIFVWLRLMKAFRAFSTLGPFIVMIGHIIDDTLKFAVLFIGFYIPYVCAFWILFGGPENARIMTAAQQPTQGWEDFNDLMYSVWQLTYVGNFPWESLLSVDRLMAQLLCGSYIAVSGIVLLNLFIALMSDTFQRVHDNAKANAAMQRASTILSLEESMSRSGREKHRRYVHQKLAPEELYYDDDSTGPQSGELERMTHQIKEVIDEVLECVQDGGTSSSDTNRRDKPRHSSIMRLQEDLARASELHEDGLNAVRQEMADLKQAINILKLTLQQQQQKHSPLMSGNSQQIFSSQHLTPVKNQAPLSHRKKHKKDQSFPGNEDERYDQVPYEGLPLPTTTTVDQLPSVSAITGRIKRHHR